MPQTARCGPVCGSFANLLGEAQRSPVCKDKVHS